MLSYLDYLVFLQAVFCTEQLYAFRRIIFSMFLRKKKLKITCPFCMGYRLTKMSGSSKCSHISTIRCFCTRFFATEQLYAFPRIIFSMFLRKKKLKITCPFFMGYRLNQKWRIFKMLSYLDYLVFLHVVFWTEQLYGFRRIIFSMFLRKKKFKITCPFCMGYRLTKMEDLQNALISRLFGVFARGFLHRTTLCIPQNNFQHVFAKKKVENNLPIFHGLQTYQNGGSSKCSHISTIWCFCTRFFAQNNSMHSVESFSACFCEKKS